MSLTAERNLVKLFCIAQTLIPKARLSEKLGSATKSEVVLSR